MMIILIILVLIYALLTIIASVSALLNSGFSFVYLLFALNSILMIFSVYPTLNLILLATSLVLFCSLAILHGLMIKDFHLSHIMVRAIISIIIFGIAFYVK